MADISFDDLIPDSGVDFDDLIPAAQPAPQPTPQAAPAKPQVNPTSVSRILGQFARGALPTATTALAGATAGAPAGPPGIAAGTLLGGVVVPVADAVNSLYNMGARAVGADDYQIPMASQAFMNLLDKSGLTTPPRNQPERIAGTVGSAVAGVGTQVPAAARLATEGATQWGRYVGAALAAAPKTQAVVAPTAAAAGQKIGEDTENKAYGLAAGLGTGLAVGIGARTPSAIKTGIDRMRVSKQLSKNMEELGLNQPSFNQLARLSEAENATGASAVSRLKDIGEDAMVVDASPMFKQTLDNIVQGSDKAAAIAKSNVKARVSDATQKVSKVLDKSMGKPGASSSRAVVVYGENANPLDGFYKSAYSKPINYAEETGQEILRTLRTRVPERFVKKANELLKAGNKESKQIQYTIDDATGNVSISPLPDVRQIDYITRAISRMARNSEAEIGIELGTLVRDLRGSLRSNVKEYDAALKTASRNISEREAREFGANLMRPNVLRDEVRELIGDMGQAEVGRVKEGLRQYIDDTIAQTKRTVGNPEVAEREAYAAIKALSSRASREKVEAVLGKGQADEMFSEIDKLAKAFELQGSVTRNSATFPRQLQREADQAALSQTVLDRLRNAPAQQPTVLGMAKKIAERSPKAQREIIDRKNIEIVNALTQRQGKEAVKYLEKLGKTANMKKPRLLGPTRIGAGMVRGLLSANDMDQVYP